MPTSTKKLGPKGSPQLMKKLNSAIVLDCIRRHEEGISRAQISRETKISQPTVAKIVEELLARKILIERGKGSSASGRKPEILSFNKDWGFVMAADLGQKEARLAVANLGGEIIKKRSFSFLETDEEEKLSQLIEEISRLRDEVCESEQGLISAAVGVPGIVDISKGTVSFAPLFPAWKSFPLRRRLERALKTRVYIDNDVNLDAFGEVSYGMKKIPSGLIFITWSTGIGGGIVLSGEILRGKDGAAGEIGFSVVGKNGLEHQVDGMGYLESIASTKRMLERALELAKKSPKSKLHEEIAGDPRNLSLELLFDLAKSRDPVCSQVVQDAIDVLSAAIATCIALLNPEVVVIGGDVPCAIGGDEFYLEKLRRTIERLVPFMPEMRWSALGPDAGVMGGIAYCLRHVNEVLLA